jgi:hypothetical protein
MKRIFLLLVIVLLSACKLQAQQEETQQEPQLLDKLFMSIKKISAKTKLKLKPFTDNLKLQYHNTPKSTNAIAQRFTISLDGGINSDLIGKKYTPFDTTSAYDWKNDHDIFIGYGGSVGHTFIHQVGFHLGIIASFQITQKFNMEYGLIYYQRKSKWEMDTDTAERNMVNHFNVKYGIWPDINKKGSIKEELLEMPIYFGLTLKRLNILLGAKIKLLSVRTIKREYITLYPASKSSYIEPIFGEGWMISDMSYPSIKIKYLVNKKKIPISIYFSTDWINNNEWDLSAGVQVGIFSK